VLKSKVANVSLSGTFLINQSQVTTVSLTSLNMKNQIDNLPDLLPSTVDKLNLANDLLYEFPWATLDALPALNTLCVQRTELSLMFSGAYQCSSTRTIGHNYITRVTSTTSYPSLAYL